MSGERFDSVLAQILRQNTPTALGAFVTVALRRLGGIDKFAKLWADSLRAAPVGTRVYTTLTAQAAEGRSMTNRIGVAPATSIEHSAPENEHEPA